MAEKKPPAKIVMLRDKGRVQKNYPVKLLVSNIKKGELSGVEEISEDGIHWTRIDKHPQLIGYFRPAAFKKVNFGAMEEELHPVKIAPRERQKYPPDGPDISDIEPTWEYGLILEKLGSDDCPPIFSYRRSGHGEINPYQIYSF